MSVQKAKGMPHTRYKECSKPEPRVSRWKPEPRLSGWTTITHAKTCLVLEKGIRLDYRTIHMLCVRFHDHYECTYQVQRYPSPVLVQ